MNKKIKLSLILLIIILILIIARIQSNTGFEVTDYQSCVDNGGEIREIFPQECTYQGQVWQENLDRESQFVDMSLPQQEKEAIENWISENNLNIYGDSIDTVYAGGSPLFVETTSESISLYDYLLKNHPSKPWLNEINKSNDSQTNNEIIRNNTEKILFTEINEWSILENPSFTIDYPSFTSTTDTSKFPINISGDSDFKFLIYAPNKPDGVEDCIQSIELGIDGYLYLCFDENSKYSPVYQRMADSVQPR